MLGVHRAAPHIDRRSTKAIHTQQIQSQGDPRNIADRIDGPHFMKVNLFDIDPVHRGLSLAQSPKNLLRLRNSVHDFEDVAQMPMLLRLGNRDVEFGSRNPASHHPLPANLRPESQRIQLRRNDVAIRPGIDKSPQEHISSHAGERVDITNCHGYLSLTGWPAGHEAIAASAHAHRLTPATPVQPRTPSRKIASTVAEAAVPAKTSGPALLYRASSRSRIRFDRSPGNRLLLFHASIACFCTSA